MTCFVKRQGEDLPGVSISARKNLNLLRHMVKLHLSATFRKGTAITQIFVAFFSGHKYFLEFSFGDVWILSLNLAVSLGFFKASLTPC